MPGRVLIGTSGYVYPHWRGPFYPPDLPGRQGPVLFQLPARFHASSGRLDELLRALDRQRLVPGLRAVLQVRHPSWLEGSLRQRPRRQRREGGTRRGPAR